MADKAESIDDRHGKQRSGQPMHRAMADDPAHDLGPQDLIAMHHGREKQHRPGLLTVGDMHGQRQGCVIGERTHRQVDRLALSRRQCRRAQLERLGAHPLPLVLVRPGRASASRNWMMAEATSTPVAFSTPSRPGDELTSMTSGPRLDCSMSTPQTLRPIDRAALIAAAFSWRVMMIFSA